MKIELSNEQSVAEEKTSEYRSQTSKGVDLYSTVHIMGKHLGSTSVSNYTKNAKIPKKHSNIVANLANLP